MIKKLFEEYKTLSTIMLFCLLINVSYACTYYMPDYFKIEGYYSLINNLAISYIAAYIFFIVQVYLPQIKKEKKAVLLLNEKITFIFHLLDELYNYISLVMVFEGDNFIPSCDFNQEIYYKELHTDGSISTSSNNVKSKFKYCEGIILEQINNLTQLEHFRYLPDKLIETFTRLKIELEKECFKNVSGIIQGNSEPGIKEEFTNLGNLKDQLENFIIIHHKIKSISFCTEREIILLKKNNATILETFKPYIQTTSENKHQPPT